MRSRYYADERDDGWFLEAVKVVLLPAQYEDTVAAYMALDEEFGSGGDERLRARKRLDARTVVALERAWKTRFVKAQIGFGKTGQTLKRPEPKRLSLLDR